MDHDYIQEQQIVDRYVMGRLSEADAELFEDHYLTCDECLRSLRLAEDFQNGFRQVAAEEATGLLAVLAALVRSRRGLVLGSILAIALAAGALLALRSARVARDLEETRARLAQAEDRTAAEARRAAESRREAGALRARLAQEQARLAAAREQQTQARARPEEDPGRAPRPRAAAAWLVTLVPVRSGPAEGEPVHRLTLPSPLPEWVVLELDLELSGPDAYRVTLERRDGSAVWTGGGLRPGPAGTLAVGLDPSLLAPGDYRLLVETAPPDGSSFPAARFSFRVAG